MATSIARGTFFGANPKPTAGGKLEDQRSRRASVNGLSGLSNLQEKKVRTRTIVETRGRLVKALEDGERGRVSSADWTPDNFDDVDLPSGFGWGDDVSAGDEWKNTTSTGPLPSGERRVETTTVATQGWGDEAATEEVEFPIIDICRVPDGHQVKSVGTFKFDKEEGYVETESAGLGSGEGDEKEDRPKDMKLPFDIKGHTAGLLADRSKELEQTRKSLRQKRKDTAVGGADCSDYGSIARVLHDPSADGAQRSAARVQALKGGLLDGKKKKSMGVKLELTTVEVRKGARKKTTARLAPIVKS